MDHRRGQPLAAGDALHDDTYGMLLLLKVVAVVGSDVAARWLLSASSHRLRHRANATALAAVAVLLLGVLLDP